MALLTLMALTSRAGRLGRLLSQDRGKLTLQEENATEAIFTFERMGNINSYWSI